MIGWWFVFHAMLALPQSFTEKIQLLNVAESPRVIVVRASDQKMFLYQNGEITSEYTISTALKGLGQKANTYQTPLGLHRIKQKIGKDAPSGAIFESREFHGEIWKSDAEESNKDLVTTRVLWLEGLEPGYNSGTDAEGTVVDSYQRYIYIHGTNHENDLGKPASHGCVRMKNENIIQFFDKVEEGDLVWIQE
jgi:lipoprotein-anchoring transpeptidase ErfK/SrfK